MKWSTYFYVEAKHVAIVQKTSVSKRNVLFGLKTFYVKEKRFELVLKFLCRSETIVFRPKIFENRNETFLCVPKWFLEKLDLRTRTGDKDSYLQGTGNT